MQQLRSWARLVPADRARLTPSDPLTLSDPLTPSDPLTGTASTSGSRRRIRHEARDGLLVAGCSLGLSVGAAGLLWLLGWWFA